MSDTKALVIFVAIIVLGGYFEIAYEKHQETLVECYKASQVNANIKCGGQS